MKGKSTKIFLPLFILVLLGGTGAYGVYYYNQMNSSQEEAAGNDEEKNKKISEETIESFKKLYNITDAEVPQVLTVEDPTKAPNHVFFANAKKGDRVIVMPKSQVAFLYRAEENKIIATAPVQFGANQGPIMDAAGSKVVVFEAKNSAVKADLFSAQIKQQVQNVEITSEQKLDQDAAKSTIYVLSEKSQKFGELLAQALGADIAKEKPAGAQVPADTDVIVILGGNQPPAPKPAEGLPTQGTQVEQTPSNTTEVKEKSTEIKPSTPGVEEQK